MIRFRILLLFLLPALFFACQESNLTSTDESENDLSDQSTEEIQSKTRLSEIGLPEVRIINTRRGNTLARVRAKEIRDMPEISSASITIKTPDATLQGTADVRKRGDGNNPNILFRLDNNGDEAQTTTIRVDITITFQNSSGQRVMTNTFESYINERGRALLQQPSLRTTPGGLSGRWTFEDAQGLDQSRLRVVVQDDPAGEINSIRLDPKLLTEVQTPYELFKAPRGNDNPNRDQVFIAEIDDLSARLLGTSGEVEATFTFLNADGKAVGEPVVGTVALQAADFKGRIRRVRIRERNNGVNYNIGAEVSDDVFDEVATVEFKVEELGDRGTFTGKPAGSSEEGIDTYEAEVSDKLGLLPGKTYTVTSTMFSKDGVKLGESVTEQVEVEGEDILESFRVFSRDNGATWTVEVSITDPNAEFDGVEVEFTELPEGVRLGSNPVFLKQTGEAEGGIEVYSAPLRLQGNPVEGEVQAIVYGNGKGTRKVVYRSQSTQISLL